MGDFAKTVLMPGDPLRAKFIAEQFLAQPKLVTSVRNVLGYTGQYKDTEVSVMASGMGMPSIGIYSYELYKFYGVENIIRIGSAGSDLFDLMMSTAQELGIECKPSVVHSSDVFYSEPSQGTWQDIADRTGSDCVEMESFALFHNANVLGKRAACLLTISDSFVNHEELSSEQRQNSLTEMMRLALETARRL